MPYRLDLNMTWEEICHHYCRQAAHMIDDPDDFVKWMITKKDINKGRVIACSPTYAYAYRVAKKLFKEKQDHFSVVVGKEGSGKSWAAAAISALISPTFNKSNILYEPGAVVDAFKTAKKGDTIHIDEGVLFLFSRTALSNDNVATTTIFQLIRQLYLHVIVCIPQFKDLDTYVRKHRTDTLIVMKDKGRPRYYLKPGIDIINDHYPKKKLKISSVKVPARFWFDGNIRKAFPIINDLSIESYEASKKQNLMDTLDRLGEKLHRGRKVSSNGFNESDDGE